MPLAAIDPAALRPLAPIALASGLGMAALYVLLPRPKALPRWLGAALAAAAPGFFLLCTLLLVLRQTYDTADLDAVLTQAAAARAQDSPAALRQSLGDAKDFERQVDQALEPLAGRSGVTRPPLDAIDALV